MTDIGSMRSNIGHAAADFVQDRLRECKGIDPGVSVPAILEGLKDDPPFVSAVYRWADAVSRETV